MAVKRPRRQRGPAPSPRVQADPGRPLVVAVDTSCAIETVAIAQGDLVLGQWHARRPKHRGASLASTVEGAITAVGRSLSDLRGAVVVTGPGAFTGLRVGIATLQGLADALGISLWSEDALTGWAAASDAEWVGVTLDARRGELYTGLFHRGVPVIELDMQTPEAWIASLAASGADAITLVGDGARLHADALSAGLGPAARIAGPSLVGPNLAPAALRAVARLDAGEDGNPRSVAPVYLRRHDGTRTP